MKLQIKFPLITILAPETHQDKEAKFDDFVPRKKMSGGATLGNKPIWVKDLPKVTTTWSPIPLDDALLLFESLPAAKYVANEEKLPLVYGSLDFVSLSTPEEVMSLVEKSGVTKVRFATAAINPDDATTQIAYATVEVSELNFEEAEEV